MTGSPWYRRFAVPEPLVSRWARLLLSLAVSVCLLSGGGVARGQPPAGAGEEEEPPKSVAHKLFDQGLADMQADQLDTACPALAESYRLEPLPGVLFTLAECENRWGKLASALTHYREFVAQVERMAADKRQIQSARVKVAEDNIALLEREAPRLTITLAADIPESHVVRRDGVRILATQLGEPVLVDPGEHTLALELPGRAPIVKTVTLAKGESQSIELSLPPAPAPEPEPEPEPEEPSALRVSAFVVGAVGIAGVIVGTIAGAIAINRHERLEENCNGLVCNEDGISAAGTVREAGNLSTAALVIGGVGVAVGLTLYFLSEPDVAAASGFVANGHGIGWRF